MQTERAMAFVFFNLGVVFWLFNRMPMRIQNILETTSAVTWMQIGLIKLVREMAILPILFGIFIGGIIYVFFSLMIRLLKS